MNVVSLNSNILSSVSHVEASKPKKSEKAKVYMGVAASVASSTCTAAKLGCVSKVSNGALAVATVFSRCVGR